MLLQTVAHCYRYPRALAYHLSAFHLHPPENCDLLAVVYFSEQDETLGETIDYFCSLPLAPRVTLEFRSLPLDQLCRRAIGRHAAAKANDADFVLFCDVDYLFGKGSLDIAAAAMRSACHTAPHLMHVREVRSSIDHEAGDAELARVDRPQLIEPNPSRYTTSGLRTAIGGSQWLPGKFLRERGYLPEGHRFLRPAPRWMRTFCDKAARNWWGLPSIPLEVPNVWRIRHGAAGRFNHNCTN